ncbi:MAG: hypothetical protein RIK87_14835 [Fuerstiella sp.]
MLTWRVLGFVAVATLATSYVPADEPQTIKVGQSAPDFTVTGIDGQPLRLSEQLKSGQKHVVLMFSRANW